MQHLSLHNIISNCLLEKNVHQVLPPGQRRSVQAVQHTEDPSSHTATCPRQTEIVDNFTLLGSNLCRTQPNSKPHIGLGENHHHHMMKDRSSGQREIMNCGSSYISCCFASHLGRRMLGRWKKYGGCNINCFQFVFLLFEASGLPYLLEEL